MEDVQQHSGETNSGTANRVEDKEAAQHTSAAGHARRSAESPQLVPYEIVKEGNLSSADFAWGYIPSEHPWISQEEKNSRIDDYSAAANKAEFDELKDALGENYSNDDG